MAKFKVQLTRMVEMVAEVEIEAQSADEARDQVLDGDPGVTATWVDGDWCEAVECYAVLDEQGELVFDWNEEHPPWEARR
jgi:hypothetical protein